MRKDAIELVQTYESLRSERENLDGTYELIEHFVVPGRGRFFEEGYDQEESIDWSHRELYDGTAQTSTVILASNVHGSLTSPSQQWFHLRFRQDELNDSDEATVWLEECAKRVNASITDSNFSLEVNEFYQDGVAYGTAYLIHDEADGPALEFNGHVFRAEMLRNAYFEEGFDRNATGFYLKRQYTPFQLAEKFGRDALPQRVLERLDNPQETDKTEDVVRAIYLDLDLQDADVSQVLAPAQRPYVGRYVLTEGHEFIGEEEGFYEFPVYVLRWMRTAGSKYGHSPGIIALGDVLTLQEMVKMVRTATEKSVDPPMKTKRRSILGDLELTAGGLTQVRAMDDLQPLLPPGAYRVDTGWADINDLRERIQQYFFVDQLQLKESPAMTATEVTTRYEMMQRLLGPTLGRIQADFLDPLLKRCFWSMYRKGALPPMPSVITDAAADLDIEYVGPLARAQKLHNADGIARWLGTLANMAQFPGAEETLDVPDYDEIADYLAEVLGVPAKLTRSLQERDERRTARTEQMQAAQQAEQAQQLAGAANQGASAAATLQDAGINIGGDAPLVQ